MEISPKLKKIIIFSSIGLGVIILGLVAYLIFSKKPAEEIPTEEELPRGEREITTPREERAKKIVALTNEPIVSPAIINKNGGGVIYYLKSNGNVFESSFDGTNVKQTSSATLNGLEKILWSPSADKIISIYNINNQIKKVFFDYISRAATVLNAGIKYIAWSPDGKKIAYNYQSGDIGNISISNPDGNDWKIILNTRMESLLVDWPNPEKIALHQIPSSVSPSHLYTLNAGTGELSKILTDIYGLETIWSQQGDRFIYSQVNSRGEALNLLALKETELASKSLNTSTFASKCVWAKNGITIYCAVPSSISGVLPDDYYKKIFNPSDDFWKIDTETGKKELLAATSETNSYNAKDLLVTSDENYLLFIDSNTGILYSVKLK